MDKVPASVRVLREYLARREWLLATAQNRWIPFRMDWTAAEIFDTLDACVQYAVERNLFPCVMIVRVGHEEWTRQPQEQPMISVN